MQLDIKHTDSDFSCSDLDNTAWGLAEPCSIDKYWTGQPAPPGRCAVAKLLWSDASLYVRFEAQQSEPLIVAEKPVTRRKTLGLWDRDVCEIFIAPDARERRRYYEFEAAPTGEWVDLAIDLTTGERVTNADYNSGLKCAARAESDRVVAALKIDWKAFFGPPSAGEIWLGNLFRCVGAGPGRGYLAWSPTLTERPNFHVPERFGEFRFVP